MRVPRKSEAASAPVLRTPAVFPAGRATPRRVAPIAFLWEMHVLAIHTPRRAAPRRTEWRAFIIRALPPRVAAEHGRPCENPAGSEALPPMHDFRWALERYAAGHSREGNFFRDRNETEDANKTFVYSMYSHQITRLTIQIFIFAKS